MAKSISNRLDALEAALERREQRRYRRMFILAAAEYGFGPHEIDDLMRDVEVFLAQPLEIQLAEVDTFQAELGDKYEAIKATLTEHYRPRN
jgi:hypothetical protein